MSVKLLEAKKFHNKIVSFILLAGVFLSCKKDRLKDEKEVFIGKWQWVYSEADLFLCDGFPLYDDTLTPQSESANYSLEFEKKGDGIGRKSFVAKLVTSEMTKIINITPLLNSNEAGVCGNLYGLALGSVDNSLRFENDPGRLAQAVPEIYALPILVDRVVLNITDALICQYEGGPRGLLHYSAVLDQLRFSRDPVALDVLSIKELTHQRGSMPGPNLKPNMELYRNAALLELGVSDVSRIQVETLR